MPSTISAYLAAEKNKVSQDTAMLVCLEITIPGETTPVRVVRNTEDISWRNATWSAMPFEFDEIADSSKGESPRVDIRIGNQTRVLRMYIEAYDLYVKASGYHPLLVSIFVVNSGNLANATPEIEYMLELKQPRSDANWMTFTLGAPSPFIQRFPAERLMKNNCQVRKFKDAACGYAGPESSCNRTLAQCRIYNNSGRYGGFAGVGNTALRI